MNDSDYEKRQSSDNLHQHAGLILLNTTGPNRSVYYPRVPF